jgi:hypothetical protein
MASTDKAIAFLESSESANISEAARKFNVNRSTLSKRFRGKTRSTAQGYQTQQSITRKQELMLVKQINKLSEWCLPPTPSMVRAWAAALCDRTIRLLGDAYLGASARADLTEEREKGLLKSIDSEMKKRKRGSAFTEQLRAGEGLGVLFFSPSKVVRARELAAAREFAKDDEALARLLQAQDRAQLKAHRELEAQQKREDRAIKATARKTKKALDKAQRERDKLAKKGVEQLRTKSRASSKRPRGRPVKQIQSKAPVAVATEPEAEIVPEQPRTRTGPDRMPSSMSHFQLL